MTTIALIDDHPLAINGIGAWLKGTGRFEIAGAAGTLAGAGAYVPKSAESNEILNAVDALLAGEIYINEKYKPQKITLQVLTRRKNEIVSLVKQSFSAKEIAIRFDISLRTVENHLAHIYAKTEIKTREELNSL